MEIQSPKDLLRKQTYQALGQLGPERIEHESLAICRHVKQYLLTWSKQLESESEYESGKPTRLRVAAYHAMQFEANLHALLIDPELSGLVDFYLPRSVRDTADLELHFAKWPREEEGLIPEGWVRSWYGAIEPPPHLAKPGLNFDLVLVPCVAASPYGERLGHGKGYYDRFLTTQSVDTKKYAICLSPQAVNEALPTEAHDHILDGRVTAAEGFEEAI